MAKSKARRCWKNARRLAKLLLSHPADYFWFRRSLRQWQTDAKPPWRACFADLWPITRERFESSGNAHGHYFLQDLWAARHVARLRPEKHVDIGSALTGFVSHVASFLPVEYIDIRPLECRVPDIEWRRGSILQLPYADGSVASLSCLHVIEHIGLGRYGDPLDVDGWIKGLHEMQRVLAPDGQLLVGTPCGRPRVQFNAHRVFNPQQIIDVLQSLELREFSLIPGEDSVAWVENARPEDAAGLDYGCGLFRFIKKRGDG